MTVGAISSTSGKYLYSTSAEYKYFGTTVSESRLNELMVRYGVVQTGDSDTDLQALYKVLYVESAKELEQGKGPDELQKAGAATQAQSLDVPWATLMGQVGLSVSGDYETDYAAFNSQINAMQLAATTQDEKASINQLLAQAAVVFVPPQNSAQAGEKAQSSQTQSLSGAEIQAQLNRLFLVTG